MEFKVGDRVEVLEPAEGLIDGQANNLGMGTVLDFDAYQVRVKVDANDGAWWYDLQNVRPLIPAGAITIIKEDPPTTVADLTTPSITVGTQVRLTGVVGDKDGDKRIRVDFGEDAEDEWAWIPCKAKCLEVIRQPFKRGEVVYLKSNPTNEIPCRILEDEDATTKGQVLLVGEYYPTRTEYVDPTLYERRP